MRATRKQFPVKLLTSGRLAFTIQRAKARRHKWRDDVEGLWVDKLAFFNTAAKRTAHEHKIWMKKLKK